MYANKYVKHLDFQFQHTRFVVYIFRFFPIFPSVFLSWVIATELGSNGRITSSITKTNARIFFSARCSFILTSPHIGPLSDQQIALSSINVHACNMSAFSGYNGNCVFYCGKREREWESESMNVRVYGVC